MVVSNETQSLSTGRPRRHMQDREVTKPFNGMMTCHLQLTCSSCLKPSWRKRLPPATYIVAVFLLDRCDPSKRTIRIAIHPVHSRRHSSELSFTSNRRHRRWPRIVPVGTTATDMTGTPPRHYIMEMAWGREPNDGFIILISFLEDGIKSFRIMIQYKNHDRIFWRYVTVKK